ncbi:DUF2357 domain-containing protein [Mycoplasmatota bacterium]|nr:DUF2357 domain-containing protein [Mycoplasmatota bacterium]
MKLMELYIQAFRALRKHTKDDENSKKLRNAIIYSNHENEVFTTIKYDCKINVEWVENIEEGLKFVENAINEDRQFIRTEGEVVPIEKVKRISKSSIEHLSRHSNFITRLPKDNTADIIPEKLYIVEKLSDYLVYENRFLYLLLCYVKDFIEIRLNKIKDKTTTYQSQMSFDKDIEETSRNIKYKLEYSDIYKNDPYLIEQFSEIPLVNRVETSYAVAVALLNTPLMKACAKAPLIKPPITKTNVLRMNQNFKAALKLYDYITAYNQEGYEIIERKTTMQPFTPEMDDEIAETVELTSVIGYITGNELRETFENKILQKEKQKQEAETKKKVEEIKRLKKRIVEMNEDPAEYILMLEKRNAKLERTSLELIKEKELNSELNIKINELKDQQLDLEKSINCLNNTISDYSDKIDEMNQKYFDDMVEAENIHQQEIESLKKHHTKVIKELNEERYKQMQDLQEVFIRERKDLQKTHENEIKNLNDKQELRAFMSDIKIIKLEKDIVALEAEIELHKSSLNQLETEAKRLDEEKNYTKAQYLALRTQQGLLTEEDDYSSKEKFIQMELEMKAYKKLFREEWKRTKKRIREQVKVES